MLRRLSLTLCVAALGVAAWLIVRSLESPEEGLVVHVLVEDEQGQPLPGAQAQAVYAPGWHEVDATGRRRLTRVVLRAEEVPSPAALRAAVHVRARYYTLRRGTEAEVEPRADGTWDMRFRLTHHGVFRLTVAPSHLGNVKAFLEPDSAGGNWEAMDRGNVARPDAPAAYRIYPGGERLMVRLVGEPGESGVVQAATRRYSFATPPPGSVYERTVTASEVKPILGAVEAPANGPRPPSLAGRVTITGIQGDGTRIAYGEVPIDHGGRFIIRTVDKGDYELTATCAYLAEMTPQLAQGGDLVTLRAQHLNPWVEVIHEGLDDSLLSNATFAFGPEQVPGPKLRLRKSGRTTLARPPGVPESCQLVILVPGTDGGKPLRGEAEVSFANPGRNEVSVSMHTVPAGRVLVKVTRAALAAAGGASVRLGAGRSTTLIAKLAEEARFENVAVGETQVTVTWNSEGQPPTVRTVTVRADAETVVEVGASVR